MKKQYGFLIAICAILGGGFAIYNVMFPAKEISSVNQTAVEQFASAFVASYFTYEEGEGFRSIDAYTNVKDSRRPSESLRSQKVISAVPIRSTILNGGYMKVEVFLHLKREFTREDNGKQREISEEDSYIVAVNALQSEQGIAVMHYPSIAKYQISQQEVNYPIRPKEDILSTLKPMLEGFFRQFFIASRSDELRSFYASGVEPNQPLNNQLEYISMQEVIAYNEQMPWIVYATIQVRDSKTKMQFPMTYEISVVRESNKYAIIEIMGGN